MPLRLPNIPFPLVLGVSLALIACAQHPPLAPPLPKVTQLESRLPRPSTPPSTQPAAVVAVAYVARADFPLEADLEPAWALTEPGRLTLSDMAGWEANGLRAAVLPAAKLARFNATLPGSVGGEVSRFVAGPGWTVLPFAPVLSGPATIRLALPPFAPQPVTLEAGRCQFLARVTVPGDQAVVELVPHHYVPRDTLTPRLPAEKELDGRIYRELALHAALRLDELLVIGVPPAPRRALTLRRFPPATRPASPPPVPPRADTAVAPVVPPRADTTPTTQPTPTSQTAPPEPAQAVLNDQLGTLLLCAGRFGKPVQMLVVIRVQATPSSPAGSSRPERSPP